MSLIRKQAGFSTLTMMMLGLVAMALLIFVIKIGPVYVESLTVRSILSQIAEETRGEGLNRAQIHDRLAKKFLVNTVKGIAVKDVLVQRGSGGAVTIDASYEVRKQLFFNLDVVVVFDDMLVTVQTV